MTFESALWSGVGPGVRSMVLWSGGSACVVVNGGLACIGNDSSTCLSEAWMQNDVECPVCDANCPLDDEPQVNLEVHCSFCGTPLKLKKAGNYGWRAVED